MKEFLRQVSLFRDLDENEVDRVSRRFKKHRVAAGERIIQENEPADRCYLIVSGVLRVTSSLSGDEETFTVLNPGDHFGEISLIDGLAPSATVVAEEPAELLSISHDDLKTMIGGDPEIAAKLLMSMLKGLCQRLRATDQSLAFTRFLMRQEKP